MSPPHFPIILFCHAKLHLYVSLFLESVHEGLHVFWVWVVWVLSVLGAQRVQADQGKYALFLSLYYTFSTSYPPSPRSISTLTPSSSFVYKLHVATPKKPRHYAP